MSGPPAFRSFLLVLAPPVGVFGVAQPANFATALRLTVALLPSGLLPVALASFAAWEPIALPTVGVGHPVKTVAPVRRAETRRAKTERPDGVSCSFQVSVNKVEPSASVTGRNLLAKDNARAALADEMEPVRPEVPLVSKPLASACRAERLARTTPCPDGYVVGPSGLSEGVGPDSDAGEEVALSKSMKFVWNDIPYISFINFAVRDMAFGD